MAAKKKTSAKPKTASKKSAKPKKTSTGAVVFLSKYRNLGVKVPKDVYAPGRVEFVDHKLEVSDQKLSDYLFENGYEVDTEDADSERPVLD